MWPKIVRIVEHIHLKKLLPGEFDWGIDYLTSNPGSIYSPKEFLKNFSEEAINHSSDFFDYNHISNNQFKLVNNLLTFPTPFSYPKITSQNQFTYARFFPSPDSKKAIIIVPHWKASRRSYVSLCKALAKIGFTAIRLTLPYHEERGEKNWGMINDFVSANVGRTIQTVRQAIIEVRAIAHWLAQNRYTDIGVLGSSIGSCIAIIADIHEPLIKSMFAIHMSSFFSDVVLEGKSTEHIKISLEKDANKEELRKYWSPISPLPFIKLLAGTVPQHFILAGKYDLTFPYHLTEDVFREYEKYKIRYTRKVLSAGHFTFRYGPFKYYLFSLILKHFKNTL